MQITELIKRHKTIMESMFSLSIINAVGMLLPFISLPYMIRVIGASNYGSYSYVYALELYFLLITSYGFLFTATKQVSENRDNPEELHRIYTSVTIAKSILFIGGLIFFLALSPILIRTHDEMVMFLWGLGIVIGDIFMPTYLYQGLEKMRYLTFIDIIPKLVFTLLIFVVIKTPTDYKYIIILNSSGFILAGILSTILARKYLNSRFCQVNKGKVIYQFRDGFSVFGSSVGMNFYRNSNVVILGLFCPDIVVGIYSGAEKIIKALQSVVSPITQALFPHMAYKFKTLSELDKIKAIRELSKKMCYLLIPLSILTFIFAPLLSKIILGWEFDESIPLIRIMSIVILFGGLNYVYGIIGMVNMNKGKQFLYYVLIAGIISVLFCSLFAYTLTFYAAAISMILAEGILMISCILRMKTNVI